MATPAPDAHPDGAALLANVWANPHDDLPRLVYADWLDDHGDGERAEFIRLQIAREAAEALGDDVGDAEHRREGELFARNGRGWLTEWNGGRRWPSDSGADICLRGFPAPTYSFPGRRAHDYLAAGKLQASQGSRLRVGEYWGTLAPDGMHRVLDSPGVGLVQVLILQPGRPLNAADFSALARCERLGRLAELALGADAKPAVLDWAASLDLPDLRRLQLPAYRDGAALLGALAASPSAARLTALNLAHVFLSTAGLASLGASGAFPRLRVLMLGPGNYSPQALTAFVGSPLAAGLRELGVNDRRRGGGFDLAMATTPPPNLRVLRFPDHLQPTAEVQRALASSPTLRANLRELHLLPMFPVYDEIKAAFGDRMRPEFLWRAGPNSEV